MYKLIFEPYEKNKLVFKPKKSDEIRKIFMNDTYWYPQRIEGKRFISLNISSADTLEKFISLASPNGNIFSAFPINEDMVCYIYSGVLPNNRVTTSLGLRPFFVTGDTLISFFPDEDFKNICQDIERYIRKVREDSSGAISLMEEDFKILRKILTTPLAANLGLYARFFEIYCGDRCVKASLSYEDPCEYCTSKVGLHPLLQVIKLVATDTWIKGYHRDLLIYLLQQCFLVDWRDITELDKTRQKTILSEVKGVVPTIKNVQDFKNELKKIVLYMVNRTDVFKILYYLSRYEGGSAILKKLFDNSFYLLPKKTEKYLFYPKFQPKLFIDGFELHFIVMSDNIDKIVMMKSKLREIFDETEFFEAGVYALHLLRYRFVCKVKRDSYYIGYADLPNVIEDTMKAIKAIAKMNELQFVSEKLWWKESWLKRISIKIVTPPQFEDAALEAFSKSWFLKRKIIEDREEPVYLFSDVKFQEELDKKIIPAYLLGDFKSLEFPVSETISTVKKGKNEWWILTKKMFFPVMKIDNWLASQVMLKGSIRSADVLCEYPCISSQTFKFKYFRDVQSNYAALNKILEREFDFKVLK